MGGHEMQEAGLVFGVAEATEVLNAGFRRVRFTNSESCRHLAVVAYSAEAAASSDRA